VTHVTGEFFYIKQGDMHPPVLATLKDADQVPINLVGTSVKFITNFGVDAPVSLLVGTGEVQYDWVAGDTDVPPGIYDGEFEIDWGGSLGKQTVPNDGHIKVVITGDLG